MSAKFTATELKLLAILSDGMPHVKRDILREMWAEFGSASNLGVHMCNIRRKLPRSQTILAQLINRSVSYRHVRLLVSVDD